MSSDLAIRVEGLGKAYTIRHNQYDHVTLAQVALERAKHPLRRSEREKFWALQDVSFEVRQGEVLGLIGRNGAGKSTLLKCLTRITEPSAGRIELWGRVGSLLEVGTGFHPELTGRENVYLNGAILGMNRKEIDGQFDAIVDFAGVEKFLDTPVKRYSSGMYVRLAFAVAAHLETEILLVDEVLAVGDQDFQKKCLGKMHDVAVGGRTVLFVSHQMSSIGQLCNRALLLDHGTVRFAGVTMDAIRAYMTQAFEEPRQLTRTEVEGPAVAVEATAAKPAFAPDEPKQFSARVRASNDLVPGTWVSFHIVDEIGTVVAQCDSRLSGVVLDEPGIYDVEVELRTPWLKPGRYMIDVFVCNNSVLDAWQGAATLDIGPQFPYAAGAPDEAVAAVPVLVDFTARAHMTVGTERANKVGIQAR